jgi:hypothetical protein
MGTAIMDDNPGAVEAGIVTKWIERYYEEKLDRRDKKGEGGMSAKARRNNILMQLLYPN